MKLLMLRVMQANLESSSAGATAPSESSAPTDLLGNPQSADGETDVSNVDSDTSTDWEALMQDEGDGADAPVVETPVVTPAPATEKPVVVAPVVPPATPAAVVTPPATPVTAQPVAAVETPPVVAAPAAPVAKTAAEVEADRVEYEKQETTRFEGLVKSYELPEDMAVKLSTEPENVLPYLAARVHQNIARQLSVAMEQMVPQFFQSFQQSNTAETAARSAFETRWPELKGMDKEVLEVGLMFRKLNPSASATEAIERIGSIVAQAKGMSVVGKPAASAAAPAVALAPKALFKPAGGGASSSAGAPAPEQNEFSRMADEFLEEDK